MVSSLVRALIWAIGRDRLRPIRADSQEETTILEFIGAEGKISRKLAKELLPLGETKIKELFNSLIEKGHIHRVGKGRATCYILID